MIAFYFLSIALLEGLFDFLGISKIGELIDIIIILSPLIVILFLVFKFVLPKSPGLGIGLAGAVGIFGYFLIKRKLKKAQDIENQISEHNEMMAEFTTIQNTRAESVAANEEIINQLTKMRNKLDVKNEQHRTKLKLIDAEINEREKLNRDLLSRSSVVLNSIGERSRERRRVLDLIEPRPTPSSIDESDGIEINGYSLSEG